MVEVFKDRCNMGIYIPLNKDKNHLLKCHIYNHWNALISCPKSCDFCLFSLGFETGCTSGIEITILGFTITIGVNDFRNLEDE